MIIRRTSAIAGRRWTWRHIRGGRCAIRVLLLVMHVMEMNMIGAGAAIHVGRRHGCGGQTEAVTVNVHIGGGGMVLGSDYGRICRGWVRGVRCGRAWRESNMLLG